MCMKKPKFGKNTELNGKESFELSSAPYRLG